MSLFVVKDGVTFFGSKHPYIVCDASLLLLGKMDLLPYVPFNLELFRADIRQLNSEIKLLELSAKTGEGMGELADRTHCVALRDLTT